MSNLDFTALLTVSQNKRPSHVPSDYVRVDHWGSSFNGARFSHYEANSETKRYWKAVKEKSCRNSGNSPKLVFKPGNKYRGTGIWVHSLIALHFGEWLSPEFAVVVKETFKRVVEGDSDLAADMMIRDHNKGRVDRAMKRVRVALSNRRLNVLSEKHKRPFWRIYEDRNIGLYGLSTKQLREIGNVSQKETPYNYLSDRDLSYADAAEAIVLECDDPNMMELAAAGIAELRAKLTGKGKLTPEFEEQRLTPQKARAIAYSPKYQTELPI